MDANLIEKEAQNMPLEIGFKRLSDNAVLPTKAHVTDSGFDLFAAQDVIIAPGETVVVPTDIAVQLPNGYEAQVRPRSGITSKTKLRVQLGTIDESYRGNIGIIVDNIGLGTLGIDLHEGRTTQARTHTLLLVDGHATTIGLEQLTSTVPDGSYLIRKHDKIAQLVVQSIPATVSVEILEVNGSERGANGFGSSGVRN